MKNLFVSYAVAKKLKDKGFREKCLAFFQIEDYEDEPILVDDDREYVLTGYRTCQNFEIPGHYTAAPTFDQAAAWLRENHNLITEVEVTNVSYLPVVNKRDKRHYWSGGVTMNIAMDDYYAAYNQAITDALEQI